MRTASSPMTSIGSLAISFLDTAGSTEYLQSPTSSIAVCASASYECFESVVSWRRETRKPLDQSKLDEFAWPLWQKIGCSTTAHHLAHSVSL